MAVPYDALVVVSFGGPEGPDEVLPFLDNVLRGRRVSPERRAAVAQHYHLFGGRSPLNDNNRALVGAVAAELGEHRLELPVYWGNRNWHPLLADTVRRMRDDGVQRALAFVTSAYASYSGCRQYLDDIALARALVGEDAPEIDKLRLFYNHPGFVRANADALRAAIDEAIGNAAIGHERPRVAFTAHSIPVAMAEACDYQTQLTETARLVVEEAAPGAELSSTVVFQSRSGPPNQPWLGPDIGDHLRALEAGSGAPVVVAPIGFVSDHMEVVYDLDTEARRLADELGLRMVRAATAGTHPAFVTMIRQLVEERLDPATPRLALGPDGPYHDRCPAGCCPPPAPAPRPPAGG